MNEYIFTSLIYLIIVCFLGHLIINNWFTPSIREGARTLPRPVLHPELQGPSYKFKPSPPYFGQTLNQIIDQFIDRYFDKRGIPYTETIKMYVNNCVNQGNVTPKNKRRLTDIGYYFLNIVIPNIQTERNSNPQQNWPAIKWSGQKTFSVLVQPTSIYFGSDYGDGDSGSGSGSGGNDGDDDDDDDDGGNGDGGNGNGGNGGDGNSPSGDGGDKKCGNDELNNCGLGCPNSCLDGIMGAWYNKDDGQGPGDEGPGDEGPGGGQGPGGPGGPGSGGPGSGGPGTGPGPSGGGLQSAEIDGYQITDQPQTSNSNSLNDKINAFIKEYFIEEGIHKNKPTQKAIDTFNMYFQYRSPMDGIHMNKMRDVVYYILQVIVPGLPTNSLPRSYVIWRPIVWLSLSERSRR
jgi:hypothetical protein